MSPRQDHVNLRSPVIFSNGYSNGFSNGCAAVHHMVENVDYHISQQVREVAGGVQCTAVETVTLYLELECQSIQCYTYSHTLHK